MVRATTVSGSLLLVQGVAQAPAGLAAPVLVELAGPAGTHRGGAAA